MKEIINYKRGEQNGGILIFENGYCEVFTECEYKCCKKLDFAKKWIESRGYVVSVN